jgi:hypothetical protein
MLALMIVFGVIHAGVHADVNGSWVFAVTLGDLGSGNATITVVEEAGGKLSGTYAGQLANGPVSGTVDGDTFEFAFISDLLGGAIIYRGEKLADGSVKGVVVAQGQNIGKFNGTQS